MKPLLRWVGGKTQLLPQIMSFVPEQLSVYVEPFLGGGALFWHLLGAGRFASDAQIILSDSNEDLISFYQMLRTDHQAVVEKLKQLESVEQKSAYYQLRDRWNVRRDAPVDRAAMFWFFNRHAFNGLWRVNRDGEFNVPYDPASIRRVMTPEDERNLNGRVDLLNRYNVTIRRASAFQVLQDLRRFEHVDPARNLIYADPPYISPDDGEVVREAFTGYTAGGFTSLDQRMLATALWATTPEWRVLASNSECTEARLLYAQFQLTPVLATRRVNRDTTKRGPVGELLMHLPPRIET